MPSLSTYRSSLIEIIHSLTSHVLDIEACDNGTKIYFRSSSLGKRLDLNLRSDNARHLCKLFELCVVVRGVNWSTLKLFVFDFVLSELSEVRHDHLYTHSTLADRGYSYQDCVNALSLARSGLRGVSGRAPARGMPASRAD